MQTRRMDIIVSREISRGSGVVGVVEGREECSWAE